MKQRALVEIGGVVYMSPTAAADKWKGITRQKIVSECKAGKIVGASKDSMDKWIIPVNARAPISDDDIRKILISLLCLKNRPNQGKIDVESNQMGMVVDYLKQTGYLENDGANDLKDLVLTEKGIHLATEGKQLKIDWLNASITLIQVVGSIVSIWKAFA